MSALKQSSGGEKHLSTGWDRRELNLRLGRARLAKLKEIAKDLPTGATPTEAIDRAIDLARSDPNDQRENLEQIACALDALEAKADISHAALDRISAQMQSLAKSVDALRALISAVADEER